MPTSKLTPAETRAAILAALSGEHKEIVARRHGVGYEQIRRLAKDAAEDPAARVREYEEELAFRRRVAELAEEKEER